MGLHDLADFSPVDLIEDSKNIFRDLVAQLGLLTAISVSVTKHFGGGHATLVLKALRLDETDVKKGTMLWLQPLEKSHEVPQDELMRFSFILPKGHFLFEAALQRTAVGSLHVDLNSVTLLRLQRRNNFRTPVPEKMGLSLILRKKNRKPYIEILKIFDLSSGGLALLSPPDTFALGDQIEGLLKCPSREDLLLTGVVRYLGPQPGNDLAKSIARVGIELLNVSQGMAQHLLSIGLQIHRETRNR